MKQEALLKKINTLLISIDECTKNNKNKEKKKRGKKTTKTLKPRDGDTVSVHYKGTLTNGKEFDNSMSKGKPFSFVVGKGQVIKGWDILIKKMKLGQKTKVKIPYHLAYGDKGIGEVIPPFSDLIFVIKLLKINDYTIND